MTRLFEFREILDGIQAFTSERRRTVEMSSAVRLATTTNKWSILELASSIRHFTFTSIQIYTFTGIVGVDRSVDAWIDTHIQ